MKKLLFIFFLFFFSAILFAQSYIPFPDSSACWGKFCSSGFQGEDQWQTYYCVGSEDTIIGANTYNKLYWVTGSYSGAYRNDTTAKKVYYVAYGDTSELLMYDFSLQVGDTFFDPPFFDPGLCMDTAGYGIVLSIDSLLIGTKYHRRINFVPPPNIGFGYKYPVIEGIGSTAGLFQLIGSCFEFGCGLVCFIRNDSILIGTQSSCDATAVIPAVINHDVKNEANIIFPNPTTGIFTVSGAGEIEVYDLFGRLVLRTKEEQVDMSSFSKGLYFVKAEEATRKLILQ